MRHKTALRHVPRFARSEAPREAYAPTPEEEADKLTTTPVRRAAAKRYRELEVTEWLVRTRGLEPGHARAMAVRLLSSAPRLRGAFQKWWLTGRVEDVEVDGYSLRRLVDEKGMTPLGALLTLSLLETGRAVTGRELEDRDAGDPDPEQALRMLEG